MRFTLIVIFIIQFPLYGCSIGYVLKQGVSQLDVHFTSIPTEVILVDKNVSEDEKNKIRLIHDIKIFAETKIGLTPTNNYTRFYNVKNNAIAYNVTACRKDKFEPYIWRFPIVGELPYKGFFSIQDAEMEKEQLQRDGYDTTLQKVAGYSTLGWFNDPIFSTMLKYSDAELTNLIIHELTHSTIYVTGNAEFNESVASFIGEQGALQFLKERFGELSDEYKYLVNYINDNKLFSDFISRWYDKLNNLYNSNISPEDKIANRELIFREIIGEFKSLKPKFRTTAFNGFENIALNNAEILAHLRYNRYTVYEKIFAQLDDISSFVAVAKMASLEKDPIEYLKNFRVR